MMLKYNQPSSANATLTLKERIGKMLNLKKIPRNHHRKIRHVLDSHVWEFYTHHNDYKGGDVGPIENINLVMEDIQLGHAHIFQDLNSDKFVVKYAGPCQWISKGREEA